jgi:hypothetical protein
MKTVVIPSDFTMEAVQVAEVIVKSEKENVRIIFTHLFELATDIQSLLFAGYRSKENQLISEVFNHEVNMLKNFNPHLLSVKTDFFYGSGVAHFKNFLEYHKADYIAYSARYGMPKMAKSSVEALPLVKLTGLPLVNTDLIAEPVLEDLEHAL